MSPIDSVVHSACRQCGENGRCGDENEDRLRSDQLRDTFKDRREEEETKKRGWVGLVVLNAYRWAITRTCKAELAAGFGLPATQGRVDRRSAAHGKQKEKKVD